MKLKPVRPVEALRRARARRVVLPDVFYSEMTARARQMAFSIAGLAQVGQLAAVKRSLDQALAKGQTLADWQRSVREGKVQLRMPAARLETIFRTNVQGAYNAGRWDRLQRRTNTHPYWLYDAVNDSRTRPAHAAMDNTVLRHDHPWWATHYPPNGYNCRCRVVALTDADAARRGISPTAPDAEAAAPDAGWDYSPGAAPKRGIQQAITQARGTPEAAVFRDRIDAIERELGQPTGLLSQLKRALGDRVYGEAWSAAQARAVQDGVSLGAALAIVAWETTAAGERAQRVMAYIEGEAGASLEGIDDPDALLPIIGGVYAYRAERGGG